MRFFAVLAAIAMAVTVAVTVARSAPRREAELPRAHLNDNLRPAGRLYDGVLTLRLEVRRTAWHLMGDDQPGGEVLAFAEVGEDPQIPGPLIRVPLGTQVRVTVRNPLDTTLVVRGLSSRRVARPDSLVVPAGSAREARFTADVAGTYYYVGTTAGVQWEQEGEDSPLTGALIVDPAGTTAPPRDRVFVMGIWAAGKDSLGDPDFSREFLVVNGRPWPLTERLEYAVGDSVRWRVINATARPHPMHLHGFFFRVDARGDWARDTVYWPGERRLAVTELMGPGTTMALAWRADRPGYWIFHCHLNYHILPNASLGPGRETAAERERRIFAGHHANPDRHALEGMGGLTLGLYVRPREGWTPYEPARRRLRLLVHADSAAGAPGPRFAFVLQDGDREPARDSLPVPGSAIVVWRGEPTSVTVVNRASEATQVHWHGLEIESYFDGVAGASGHPGRLTPAIAPGDSFEMRITPPRAGSFMYHTHVNDIRQQTAGLYGPFLVLEPGRRWDPETDRVVMLSNDRDGAVLLNGTRAPAAMSLTAGVRYRLRFMNITVGNPGLRVRVVRDGWPMLWRPLARDGADLPPHQAVGGPAERTVSIGNTYDVEFVAPEAGALRLEVRAANGRLLVSQVVTVHP